MSNSRKITAIFPGQGGIGRGLGEEAFTKSKEAKKVFFAASAEVGIDLAEVAFGSDEELLLENSQMIRTAASEAEYIYATERGLRIDGAGGHSLGQMAAFAVLGAVERTDLYAITHARQRAMQYSNKQNEGLMISLKGFTESWAGKIAVQSKAALVNLNASNMHVLSGRLREDGLHMHDRVEAAVSAAKRELAQKGQKISGIRVRPLGKETGAAHHPELQIAGQHILQEEVDRRKHKFKHIKPGTFQGNSVRWLTTPDQIAEEIVSGLTSGVNWQGQLCEYYQSGYHIFYEPNSSKVLTKLIAQDYETKILNKKFGDLVQVVGPKQPSSKT
jgi:malonyl CoA-acyl carrier protein transacylase